MSDDLPVPFDDRVHDPVGLGYRRARRRDKLVDIVGDVGAVLAKSLARSLFR